MRTLPPGPSAPRVITLNAILRAVFGAEGTEFTQLRKLLPSFVALGSRLVVLPIPAVDFGRWSPWGRFWLMRREYDAIVEKLIAKAERDDNLDEREDRARSTPAATPYEMRQSSKCSARARSSTSWDGR